MRQQSRLSKLTLLPIAFLIFVVVQSSLSAVMASDSDEVGLSEAVSTLIPTKVELLEFPEEIPPGQNFTVSGKVSVSQLEAARREDSRSISISGLIVAIYLNPSTSPEFSTGYYIVKVGEAVTRPDGTFSTTVTAPLADGAIVLLGGQILSAKVEGGGNILGSWSPRYRVFLKSSTIIKQNVFKDGTFLVVLGKLEDNGGNPVSAVPVKILLNDHTTGVLSTGFDGTYEARIRLRSADYNRPVRVLSIFSGTEKYQPASATQDFELISTSSGPFSGFILAQNLPAFGVGVGLGAGAALGLAFLLIRKPLALGRQRELTRKSLQGEQSAITQPQPIPQLTEEERSKNAIDVLANAPSVEIVKGAYGEIRRYLAATLPPESKSMTPRELLALIDQRIPSLSQLVTDLTVMFENVNYRRQNPQEVDVQAALEIARKILAMRSQLTVVARDGNTATGQK